MKLTITRVTNGYVVKGNINDSECTQECVIEETENDEYGYKAFTQLCWLLSESFGIINSKHNKEQFNIEVSEREI